MMAPRGGIRMTTPSEPQEQRTQISEISPLVRKLLSDASLEEQIRAQENFRGFVEALYRIYERLEREGRFPLTRDKLSASDTVNANNSKKA